MSRSPPGKGERSPFSFPPSQGPALWTGLRSPRRAALPRCFVHPLHKALFVLELGWSQPGLQADAYPPAGAAPPAPAGAEDKASIAPGTWAPPLGAGETPCPNGLHPWAHFVWVSRCGNQSQRWGESDAGGEGEKTILEEKGSNPRRQAAELRGAGARLQPACIVQSPCKALLLSVHSQCGIPRGSPQSPREIAKGAGEKSVMSGSSTTPASLLGWEGSAHLVRVPRGVSCTPEEAVFLGEATEHRRADSRFGAALKARISHPGRAQQEGI